MKKNIILFLMMCLIQALFCTGFDEKNLSPSVGIGGGGIFRESVKKGTFYTKETSVGPTIGLDSIFSMKKNGFTLMANGLIYALLVDQYNNDPYDSSTLIARNMGFGVVGWVELLFGYTHGIGEKFEVTIAIGPGFFMPMYPTLNTKLSASYFPAKKCGLYLSLGNCFAFGNTSFYGRGDSWILTNITTFSIGPIFKLGK